MPPLFDTLQDALITFAAETYQTEKWAELADYLSEIDHATSEHAAHLSAIYDLTFPFELYLNHLEVTPDLRRKLAEAVAALTDRAPRPLSLFAVRDYLDAENRAGQRQTEPGVVPAVDWFTAQRGEAATVETAAEQAGESIAATPEPAADSLPKPEDSDEAERRRLRLSETRTLAQRIARLSAPETEPARQPRQNRPATISLGGAR